MPYDDLDALSAQTRYACRRCACRTRTGRRRHTCAGRGLPRVGGASSAAASARCWSSMRSGPPCAWGRRSRPPPRASGRTSSASARHLPTGCRSGSWQSGPSVSRKTRMPRREHDEACPPLVCAAANATIRTALGPTLRALAELASERLQGRLRALRLGEIREVRGCGAMVAIETSLNAPMLLRRLEQRGLLALPGGTGTIRLLAAADPGAPRGRRRRRGDRGDDPGEPSTAATLGQRAGNRRRPRGRAPGQVRLRRSPWVAL